MISFYSIARWLTILPVAFLISSVRATPVADDFLKAYFLIQDGDASEKSGDVAKSIEKYSEALDVLRTIKRTAPDWDPKIITYRIKYCVDHIEKNNERKMMFDETVSKRVAQLEHQIEKIDSANEERFQKILKENGFLKEQLGMVDEGSTGVSVEGASGASTTEELNKLQGRLEAIPHDKVDNQVVERPVAKSSNVNLVTENRTLKEKLASIEAELTQSKANIKELSETKAARSVDDEHLQALLKENSALKKILDEAEEQFKGMRARVEEAASLKTQLAQNQSQLQVFEKDLKAVTEAKNDLESRLQKAEATPRANPDEVNSLRSELAKNKAELERTQVLLVTALDKEKMLHAAAANEYEARLKKAEADLQQASALSSSYVSNQERIQILDKENTALKKILNGMVPLNPTNIIPSSNDDLNSIKAEFVKTQNQFQLLQDEYKVLKSSNNDLKTAHESVKKELDDARVHIVQMESLRKASEETGAGTITLQLANESLKKELEEARLQLGQLSSLQQKYEGIRTSYDSLAKELEDARIQLKLASSPSQSSNPSLASAILSGKTSIPADDIVKLTNPPQSIPSPSPSSGEHMGESKISGSFAGSVVLLSPKDNFVIVNFQPGNVPPLSAELNVYRENIFIGTVRITDPIKPPLASAQIISGSIQRGDIVR